MPDIELPVSVLPSEEISTDFYHHVQIHPKANQKLSLTLTPVYATNIILPDFNRCDLKKTEQFLSICKACDLIKLWTYCMLLIATV